MARPKKEVTDDIKAICEAHAETMKVEPTFAEWEKRYLRDESLADALEKEFNKVKAVTSGQTP